MFKPPIKKPFLSLDVGAPNLIIEGCVGVEPELLHDGDHAPLRLLAVLQVQQARHRLQVRLNSILLQFKVVKSATFCAFENKT